MKGKLLGLFFVAILAGCSSTPSTEQHSDKKYISDALEKTLAELSKKAVESKQIMLSHKAAMARLHPDASKYQPVLDIPKGLDRVIPMKSFYGDALEPIELVAKLTNYQFKVSGPKKNTEVLWVKLFKSERSAIDILDDISNQIDNRGVDIDVWETPNAPKTGVIMVNYRGSL